MKPVEYGSVEGGFWDDLRWYTLPGACSSNTWEDPFGKMGGGPGETVVFGLGKVGSGETDERKPSDKSTQSSSYMQPLTLTVPVLSFRMENV